MTQDRASVLVSFAATRGRLKARLTETEQAIDVWLERYEIPVPLAELAQLEVLLKNRRDRMQEFIDLDDGLVDYLMKSR